MSNLPLTPRPCSPSAAEEGCYSVAATPTSSPSLHEINYVPSTTNEYPLPVDTEQFDRATKLQPCSMLRPHMRAFHIAWLSAFPAFFGWYAIPPLMPIIKSQLQLSNAEVLDSDIASTASTIISRIVIGPVLEIYGPQHVQSAALWLGAIPIVLAAFVTSSTALVVVRFFIGLVGCIFVSSQFWTTITFAKNVVGTSNAIAGGLGLSGIGYAFLILPNLHSLLASADGVSEDIAWRLTIALPAALMLILGAVAWTCADSCPMGEYDHLRRAQHTAVHSSSDLPKATAAQVVNNLINSLKVVLSDWNTYILMLHYGASFGVELQVNNMGALYFYEEFQTTSCVGSVTSCPALSKSSAALVASTFGIMNMFARALGGFASDYGNQKGAMRGRLWIQFFALVLEGIAIIILSKARTLGMSIPFYMFVAMTAQAAGGSTFGIVPYLNESYTGTVVGLVGAGGNMGGVIFGIIFRMSSSRADGLLVMGCLVLASSIFTSFIRTEKGWNR